MKIDGDRASNVILHVQTLWWGLVHGIHACMVYLL